MRITLLIIVAVFFLCPFINNEFVRAEEVVPVDAYEPDFSEYTYDGFLGKFSEYEGIRTEYFELKRVCPSPTGINCTGDQIAERLVLAKELVNKRLDLVQYYYRATFSEFTKMYSYDFASRLIKKERLAVYDDLLEEIRVDVDSAKNILQLVEVTDLHRRDLKNIFHETRPFLAEIASEKLQETYDTLFELDSKLQQQQDISRRFGGNTDKVMESRVEFLSLHKKSEVAFKQKNELFGNYAEDFVTLVIKTSVGVSNMQEGITPMLASAEALSKAMSEMRVLYARAPWN